MIKCYDAQCEISENYFSYLCMAARQLYNKVFVYFLNKEIVKGWREKGWKNICLILKMAFKKKPFRINCKRSGATSGDFLMVRSERSVVFYINSL